MELPELIQPWLHSHVQSAHCDQVSTSQVPWTCSRAGDCQRRSTPQHDTGDAFP